MRGHPGQSSHGPHPGRRRAGLAGILLPSCHRPLALGNTRDAGSIHRHDPHHGKRLKQTTVPIPPRKSGRGEMPFSPRAPRFP